MTVNPAQSGDLGYIVQELYGKLSAMNARVAALEGARGLTGELARVVSVGGSQCTVQYPDYVAGETPASVTFTGVLRPLVFGSDWTPVVGADVFVLNSPAWSGVGFPVSGI